MKRIVYLSISICLVALGWLLISLHSIANDKKFSNLYLECVQNANKKNNSQILKDSCYIADISKCLIIDGVVVEPHEMDLILRVSGNNCVDCNEKSLDLADTINVLYPKIKIVIMSDYPVEQRRLANKEFQRVSVSHNPLASLCIENMSTPYFLLVRNKHLLYSYIPDFENVNNSIRYLKCIACKALSDRIE